MISFIIDDNIVSAKTKSDISELLKIRNKNLEKKRQLFAVVFVNMMQIFNANAT